MSEVYNKSKIAGMVFLTYLKRRKKCINYQKQKKLIKTKKLPL